MQRPSVSDSQQHNCQGYGTEGHGTSRYFRHGPRNAESSSLSRQFRPVDLLNAKIINQVDRKFIACLIDDDNTDAKEDEEAMNANNGGYTPGRALVLIDQHAADERVRVERFLKDLCLGFLRRGIREESAANGVEMRELSPPVPVLLTRHEASRLGSSADVQQAFESWGFHFSAFPEELLGHSEDDMDIDSSNVYVQVFVRCIPEIVGDKVRLSLLCSSRTLS